MGFAIGFTEISIPRLFKTVWFQGSIQNTLYAILCWVSEHNEQVHSENYFFAWKLISFHFSSMFYAIYSVFQDLYQICLCVIFSIQNVQSINLDPKHFIQLSQQSKMSNQGQEFNITLWNLFLWIQSLRIGVRDRNSYFYHQRLFLEVILLSTLSKKSNYVVKTSKVCLGTHLIGFSTLELG